MVDGDYRAHAMNCHSHKTDIFSVCCHHLVRWFYVLCFVERVSVDMHA